MNRKRKSSLILIVIAIILIPLIYQLTNKLNQKIVEQYGKYEQFFSETKTEMQKTPIGKWSKGGELNKIWDFTSDSTLIINGNTYRITREMNLFLIEGEEDQMIECIVENDSTLAMWYVKTKVSNFFDNQNIFKLKRIKNK